MPLTLPGIAAGAATVGRQVNLGLRTAGHMLRNSAVQPHLMGMMQRLKHYEPGGLAALLTRVNPFGSTAHAAPPLPPRPGSAATPPPLPPRPGSAATPPPLPPRPGSAATPPPLPPRPGSAATPPPLPPRPASAATPPPLPPRPGSAATPPPLPPRRAAHPLQTRFRQAAALAAQQPPEEPEDLSNALVLRPRQQEAQATPETLVRRPPQEDLEDMSKALVLRGRDEAGAVRPQAPVTHDAADRPPPLPPRPANPANPANPGLSPVLAMALDNVRRTLEAPGLRLPAGMARQIHDMVAHGLQSLNAALAPHIAPYEALWNDAASRHGEHRWLAEAGEQNALGMFGGQAVPGQDPHQQDRLHRGARR